MPAWVAPLLLSLAMSGGTAYGQSQDAKRALEEEERKREELKKKKTGPDPAALEIKKSKLLQEAGLKQSRLQDEQGRLLDAVGNTDGAAIANMQRNISAEFAQPNEGITALDLAALAETEREDKDKETELAGVDAVIRALKADVKNPYYEAATSQANLLGQLVGDVPEVRARLMPEDIRVAFEREFPDNPELSSLFAEMYGEDPEKAQRFIDIITKGMGNG